MALTDPQMMSLFEILEVPYTSDGTIYTLTPQGDAAFTGISYDSIALQKAYSGIQTWVSGMSGSGLDKLTGLLTNWDALGSDMTSIDGGSIGDIQGITYSAERNRERIATKVRGIVPFYRNHEKILRNPGGATVFIS